jgi:hypothetical protein
MPWTDIHNNHNAEKPQVRHQRRSCAVAAHARSAKQVGHRDLLSGMARQVSYTPVFRV